MLYITTDDSKLFINDIEQHFNSIVDKSIFDSDICYKIMKDIDNANYIGNEIVETPFGKTLISNLSTGCKSVLLLMSLNGANRYIPITECGINAIKCIFELAKTYDLYAYTNYGFLLDDNAVKCVIDGEEYAGISEIYHRLEK